MRRRRIGSRAMMKPASTVLAALLATVGAARAEERFALVIGANDGWSDDRPLRHAESDARRVADVLVELGQFPSDRVSVLREPDTAQVRAELSRLAAAARAVGGRALVFLYYSGHADDRYLHLRGEPLGFDELYRALRDLPAAVRVGVLDACRSGAILAAKGGVPAARFDVTTVDELSVHGLALVTSSGADELSQEQRALQGSVFTHHLVSALRGAADDDQDGAVTLSEAYRYAYARTEADTAGTLVPQRPAFRYELKGQGDLVLTWPARAAAALVLPRTEARRYVVVDDAELRLVAEGSSAPDRDVTLALPPGRYRVKRVLADKLEVATATLVLGAHVPAGALVFAPQPLSSGFLKGALPVRHPRGAFWGWAGGAVAAGALWAGAGRETLVLRGQYGAQPQRLSPSQSATLTGWAVTADGALALTAALAIIAAVTW